MGQPRKSDLDALATPFDAGEHERAARAARRFTRRWPDHPAGWATLGKSLYRLGRLEEAESALTTAIRLEPAAAQLHNDLGLVLLRAGRPADAEARLRAGLEDDPDNPGLLANLAAALAALRRPREAERMLRRALVARPNDPQLIDGLASALRNQRRYDEAARQFRHAASLQPRSPRPLTELGSILRELGEYGEAEACFRRAAELAPDQATSHVNLGVVLADRGRRDEALACFRRAQALDPHCVAAHTGALGVKQPEPEDPDIAALGELLADTALDPVERARGHYAIGDALARLGTDPDTEWRHFRAGAALRRQQLDYDPDERAHHFARLRAVFTDAPAAPPASGAPTPRPLFVVGMPRSGTTLVEQILAAHPAIETAGERADAQRLVEATAAELGTAYPDGFDALDPDRLARIGRDYRAAVTARHADAAWVIDKQPDNHRHVGLLARALPEARFVHVVREPADTCVSCFVRNFHAPWTGYTNDLAELGRYYRLYADLMAHWSAILPSGRLIEVRYEAVATALEDTIRPVLEALGLEWDPACTAFHRSDRGVSTASRFQVRQPLYHSSIGRWRRYADHLGPLFAALGPLAPADAAAHAGASADPLARR